LLRKIVDAVEVSIQTPRLHIYHTFFAVIAEVLKIVQIMANSSLSKLGLGCLRCKLPIYS